LTALLSKSIYDKEYEYTGNRVQQFWTVAMAVYNSRHVLCTAVLDSCHGICPENTLQQNIVYRQTKLNMPLKCKII